MFCTLQYRMQVKKELRMNKLSSLMEDSEKQKIRIDLKARVEEMRSEHESEIALLKKVHKSTLNRITPCGRIK